MTSTTSAASSSTVKAYLQDLQQRIVAALDVFDREPLPVKDPLRSAPNTVLMPHMGYGVQETWDGFYPQMLENALAFLDGKPVRVTNPEVLKA